MNSTLVRLKSHLGRTLIVSDEIYLYNEMIWLEPNFPVLLLDAFDVCQGQGAQLRGRARVTAIATATAAHAAVAITQLLYPDGTVRWTYVIVGVYGYKNSLVEM